MKSPEFLSVCADIVEKELDRIIKESPRDVKVLSKAMRYSTLGGGKRVRAALCMEFCKICGGTYEDALNYACALEMIHASSLIHDDMPCMDNDDLRRGKPSCHKAFGEDTALLAGDALILFAFETALSSNNPYRADAALVLARSAGYNGMCGGQELDLYYENKKADHRQLTEIQALKTGALISAAAEMGCIAAGASEEQRSAAVNYAKDIGLVFQMVDDILDVTADEAVLGKPVGSDEENDKSTFVTLLGIEKTMEEATAINERAKSYLSVFGEKADELRDLADYLLKRIK